MFASGLFGYVYDMWQWSVWICFSGLFVYVYDMWQWTVWICL